MLRCWLLVLLLACFITQAHAQTCPDNIDFKEGTFDHWECQTGGIDRSGVITFTANMAVPNRQTIIPYTDASLDPYGGFPIVGPNGPLYSIRLGNEQAGAQAEQASYTYTIPSDKTDYVFTYYYAVVLQLTNHQNFERPRFAVKLTDLTDKKVIDCGTHDFVSGDGLGDFKTSKITATGGPVEYRDWSTVAVNLSGRQGHTIKFDFTTNDCVYSAHFGYAYISFDDPCIVNKDPITGSNYCNGTNYVALSAPPGFNSYTWHKDGQTTVEGTGQHLLLAPVPADGTKYVVDAVSTTGVGAGCPASFKTTIHKIDEDYVFKLQPSVTACIEVGADLTNPALTTGSSSTMTYKYYEDGDGRVSVRNPKMVIKTGRYFIRATNRSGCTDVQPIDVTVLSGTTPAITPPAAVCAPITLDLTDPAIVGGIDPNATYSYYKDPAATIPVTDPRHISVGGNYYIKVVNQLGCAGIAGVTLTILEPPHINSRVIQGCAPLDLSLASFHEGDTYGLTYTYFTDVALKNPLTRTDDISKNGTLYVMGANSIGCMTAGPAVFTVKIYDTPVLDITKPDPVKYPKSIDLSTTFIHLPGYTYTYSTDSLGLQPVKNYAAILETGKYFIKAATPNGCQVTKSVIITITEPDPAGILVNNTFTPNSDGINDEFVPVLQGVARVDHLKIYTRSGNLIFETKDLNQHWKGYLSGQQLPPGAYYWIFSGYDEYRKKAVTQSGFVTIIR